MKSSIAYTFFSFIGLIAVVQVVIYSQHTAYTSCQACCQQWIQYELQQRQRNNVSELKSELEDLDPSIDWDDTWSSGDYLEMGSIGNQLLTSPNLPSNLIGISDLNLISGLKKLEFYDQERLNFKHHWWKKENLSDSDKENILVSQKFFEYLYEQRSCLSIKIRTLQSSDRSPTLKISKALH